jgi:hypothetical protein
MGYETKQIGAWAFNLVNSRQGDNSNSYLARALKAGGVEGWAQGELGESFEELPQVRHVHREPYIYTNNDRADFLIEHSDGEQIAIEMKCESLLQSASLGRVKGVHTFHTLVEKDIEALKYNRKPEYARCRACVLVILFSSEAAEGLDSYLAPDLAEDRDIKLTVDARHQGSWPVYVYCIPVS